MKAIFFPKSELPVKVCSHRYGSKMTITEQTDKIVSTSRYAVEYYAHKHGLRVGSFYDTSIGDKTDLVEAQKYGCCKFDLYSTELMWYNPTTKVIEFIPDFFGDKWTQAGIDAFGYLEGGVTKINGVAVSVGDPKTVRTPTPGIQMYEYSNGKYGWSSLGVFGNSHAEEVIKYLEYDLKNFYNIFGFFPSAKSYSYGIYQASSLSIIPFLQARNSITHGDNGSWYGKDADGNYLGKPNRDLTRDYLKSRGSCTRAWDDIVNNVRSKSDELTYVAGLIAECLINGGWYNDFTHWHSVQESTTQGMNLSYFDDYFDTIKTAIGANQIYSCSWGEATEYMIFRTCVGNVSAYVDGNRVKVAVYVNDPFKGTVLTETNLDGKLPEGLIKTPISVEVDLSNTPLEACNVKTTFGKVVNAGSNKVIVEIPFPEKNEGISEIEIYNCVEPEFLSLEIPIISNFENSDGVVTFDTDIPCYSMLFSITDEDNISKVGERQVDEYKTHHHVVVKDTGSFSLGVISEAGKTAVYDFSIS